MNNIDPEIDGFLQRYASTLTDFDAAGAAALWAMPGVIVDDRVAGVLDDRATMAQGLEQSYPIYRKLGLASVDYERWDRTRGQQCLLHRVDLSA